MGVACLCGNAQFFNPYNTNLEYYREAGRRAYQQAKAQLEAQDASTTTGCFTRIVNAIAKEDFDEAEKWADKMCYVDEGEGYYYLGIVNELQGFDDDARRYYEMGVDENNRHSKAELKRITTYGPFTDEQKENVVNYCRQLQVMSYNAAAQMSNNIWGDSSFGSGSSYSSGSTRRTCPGCNGSGKGTDQITYTTDYTGNAPERYCSKCGKVTFYHSHNQPSCPVCHGRGYVE